MGRRSEGMVYLIIFGCLCFHPKCIRNFAHGGCLFFVEMLGLDGAFDSSEKDPLVLLRINVERSVAEE